MSRETLFNPECFDSFDTLRGFVEDRSVGNPFNYVERIKIMEAVKRVQLTKEQVSTLKRIISNKIELIVKPRVAMSDEQLEWQKLFFNLGIYYQTVFDGVEFNEQYQ
jgi:hypothetical protein